MLEESRKTGCTCPRADSVTTSFNNSGLEFLIEDSTVSQLNSHTSLSITPGHIRPYPKADYLEAEPEFSEPIQNVTIAIGRDTQLSCTVENLGTYRAAWIKVETKAILTIHHHIITRNYRISLSHSDNRNFILQIRNVQPADKGGYMCQVNTVPMKSQVGYLDVLVPPDILDHGSSSDVVVREGANVTLTCKAVGYPAPNITWRREDNEPIPLGAWQGKKVTDPNAVTYEGEVLSITRVSRLHTGAYLCIAANGVPPSVSRRVILHVHFPPVLWIPNQLVGAALGRDVSLDCHTEAYPTSINYWGRKPNEMIISNERLQITTKEKTYKTHMRLTIMKLQPQDFGVYMCFSKNSLGSTEGSVRLYEIQPPTANPTRDSSSVRRQSSEAFPQHQSLGSVKDSTEDSSVSKWKRPVLTDGAYKTKEHINTVEDSKEAKLGKDSSHLRNEIDEGSTGNLGCQFTWMLLFLCVVLHEITS
ncbi:lachesin-like [Uloborus diversus]|uniref:lachesin-like n=1 Tax=Uloborus diversus TaxID=327109 RepID=UPI00240A972F|nr:lachesin-like [Uloborus diversus]